MRKKLSLVLVSLFLCARAIMAADDPASDRGFKANALYDTHDVDAVNAMNGALTATIPLGQRYRTNGTLSYQFTLSYSSQIWDWLLVSGGSASDVTATSQVGAIFGGGNDNPPVSSNDGGAESYPSRDFNAGLGWSVSLGELHEVIGNLRYHWEYVSEDGAGHPFYNALHAGEDPQITSAPTMYTRDSSYIRLVQKSATMYEVQLPDGIHKRFVSVPWPDRQLSRRWVLSQITDPYGNILWVQRTPDAPCTTTAPVTCQPWMWTLTEATSGSNKYVESPSDASLQTVRTHTLSFEVPKSGTTYRWYEVRLTAMSLASTAGPASYGFTYADTGIMRAMNSTWGDVGTLYVPFDDNTPANTNRRVTVSTLRSVTLPADAGTYGFNYYVGACSGTSPAPCFTADQLLYTWNGKFSYFMSNRSGRLAEIVLPAGGAITYDYEPAAIPQRMCGSSTQSGGGVTTIGVSARRLWKSAADVNVGQAAGTWRYTRTIGAPVLLDDSRCNKELLSAAVDPHGTATLSYFSVYISDTHNTLGWNAAEWGMPFSRYEADDDDNPTRFISSQVFQCGTALNLDDPAARRTAVQNMVPRYGGTATTCGDPVRSKYVRYDYSPAFNCGTTDDVTSCLASNQRVVSELTRFHDDRSGSATPEIAIDYDTATFDGLGHFRKTTTSSANFRFDAGRVEIQDWNPNNSSSSIPAGGDWILNTFTRTLAYETHPGGTNACQGASPCFSARKTLFDFDAATGWLKAKRVLSASASSTPGAVNDGLPLRNNDHLVFFDRCYSGQGLPCASESMDAYSVQIREQHYGGDGQSVGTSAASPFARGGTAEYSLVKVLRYGGAALQKQINTGALATSSENELVMENNDVDAASGAVTASKDAAGLKTSFTYDAYGRLTRIASTDGNTTATNVPDPAVTTIAYVKPASGKNAYATLTRSQNNVTFEETRYEYDYAGRMTAEQHTLPGGSKQSLETTSFDATGLTLSHSTVGDAAASAAHWFTTYDYLDGSGKFDAFGRVHVVTQPNGKKTSTSYAGIQSVNTTSSVATALDGSESDATTTHLSDALGRLRRVADFSSGDPSSNNTAATDYAYDAGGNLFSVTMDGAAGNQRRFMVYDGRDVVTDETLPEINDGTIHYAYDSRGHVRSRRYGTGSKFDLAYSWDFAGRLRGITDVDNDRPLEERAYYDRNADDCGVNAGYARGKLKSATRYNWVRDPRAWSNFLPSFAVSESYLYTGVGGAVSSISTLGQRSEQFLSSYGYNPAGELTSITYPSCSGCPARTVVQTWSYGKLSGVTGYANISYYPNGLMQSVEHLNANSTKVIDNQVNDPNDLRRPAAIYTSGVANNANWNGGASRLNYFYDGAGHIKGIKTTSAGDQFAYDRAGRLIKSFVGGDTNGIGGIHEDYTYDRWCNLLKVTREGTPFVSFTADNHNHLSGVAYDVAGNVITNGAYTYEYDALGAMNFVVSSDGAAPAGKVFLYAPSGNRIAVWDFKGGNGVQETWSLRDAAGRVLRDAQRADNGAWSWGKDYLWRGSTLLDTIATVNGTTVTHHISADHLGSPRLITDARDGSRVAFHTYLPYGAEINAPADGERVKFTGSERDENDTRPGTQDGDLDYMHARYYRATQGRFLSIDPAAADPAAPQTWNRYAYVTGDPVSLVDPSGMSSAKVYQRDSVGFQMLSRHGAPALKRSSPPTQHRTWFSRNNMCVSPAEAARIDEAKELQSQIEEAAIRERLAEIMAWARARAAAFQLKLNFTYWTGYDLEAADRAWHGPPTIGAMSELDVMVSEEREREEMRHEIEVLGHLIEHHHHLHEPGVEGMGMHGENTHEMIEQNERIQRDLHALEELLRKID